jgi:hypothetical protein
MKANTRVGMKLLKKRFLGGTAIGKFKNFFGKIIAFPFA